MKASQPNQVRIIAGQWRSRKINFPEVVGLRPSSDRVRETLFNWLMNEISGAHCLDLFAGSGILGLEALSRGAARVVAVDESALVIKALRQNAVILATNKLQCVQAAWPAVIKQLKEPFDIVFLDPPFGQGLIEGCCASLVENNLLNSNAWIYVEMEVAAVLPKFPENWELFREMKTQQVRVLLFRRV